jgi:AAA domain, putative AbiEii toxin, Type IV TA system
LAGDAPLSQPFIIEVSDHWQIDPNNAITLQIGHRIVRTLQPTGKSYKAQCEGGSDFAPVAFFRLPFDVKMSAGGFADRADAVGLHLGSSGENVAAMVDFMLRRSRSRFDAMESEAKELIPGLQSLSVSTPNSQTRRLDLVMEGGWEMPADNASSGVRLLLFFLALTHRPDPPKTILIEEPENGIHPLRLEAIMRMLIRLAESNEGPQIILSTHSPYLLDHLTLGKHGVLVFSRDAEGGCTAREVDAERLKPFLKEFMLGEVWMNQGEDELVVGKVDI